MGAFYARHVCRIDPMPKEVTDSFAELEKDSTVYMTMCVLIPRGGTRLHAKDTDIAGSRNGPSEFHVTGSLRSWTVIEDLHKITVPTLLLNSRYDEAQDSVVEPYFKHISNVKWFTFAESSHMPHYEERELYMQRVGRFLADDM